MADIKRLADAWETMDMAVLVEFCDVTRTDARGTRLVIDSQLWSQLMDELEGRRWDRLRKAEDLRAQEEGFENAKKALDYLRTIPTAEAYPVYVRIFT